jgi:CO dehydrogenase maturation factor
VGATLEESDLPVVLDMEASLEHMSRNTVRHIDIMLIVTEPYFRSLETARRLFRLANEIPIEKVFGVANKVRNKSEETAIRSFLDQKSLPLLAIIPYDECVSQADLNAQSLIDFQGDAPAVSAIEQLLDKVLEIS